MTDRYTLEHVGAVDGTLTPPKKLDGKVVGSKLRRIRGSKAILADAIADRIYLGRLPVGSTLSKISITTDTSLGTSTLAIGTTATPAKYMAAKVFTTPLDTPTIIGPKASTYVQAPLTVEEDIWATVAVAALPVGAIVGFELEYSISA